MNSQQIQQNIPNCLNVIKCSKNRITFKSPNKLTLENYQEIDTFIKRFNLIHLRRWGTADTINTKKTALTNIFTNFDNVESILDENLGWFEVIYSNPKVYLDFDNTNTDNLEFVENYLQENNINYNLYERGEKITNRSFHLILTDYVLSQLSSNDPFLLFLNKKGVQIDKNVYGMGRILQCIHQYKIIGSNEKWKFEVFKKIKGAGNISDSLLTPNQNRTYQSTLELPISLSQEEIEIINENIDNNRQHQPINIENTTLTKEDILEYFLEYTTDFKKTTNNPIILSKTSKQRKLNLLPNPNKQRHPHNYLTFHICFQIMMACKCINMTFDDFWKWNKQKDNSIDRRIKYETKYNHYNPSKNKDIIDYLLLNIYKGEVFETEEDYQFNMFVKCFDITKITSEYPDFHPCENVETLDDRVDIYKYEYYDIKEGCVNILYSGMGSGKTFNTNKFCKNQENQKILYISSRRAVLQQHNYDTLELEFFNISTSRREDKPDHFRSKQYIECCFSTSLTQCPDDVFFDIVIVDEFQQLIEMYFADEINNSPIQLMNTFIRLLQQANTVILMDAMFSISGLYHIRKCIFNNNELLRFVGRPIQKDQRVINLNIPNRKLFKKTLGKLERDRRISNDIINKIANEYNKAKEFVDDPKLFIYLPWKKDTHIRIEDIASKLEQLFQKKVIVYHSSSSNTTDNVNEQWIDASFVITTNKITTGVSYNNPVIQFYKTMIFTDNNITSYRDVFQVSMRIRNPISKEIDVFVYYRNHNKTLPINHLYDRVSSFYIDEETHQKFIKYLEFDMYFSKDIQMCQLLSNVNGFKFNLVNYTENIELDGMDDKYIFSNTTDISPIINSFTSRYQIQNITSAKNIFDLDNHHEQLIYTHITNLKYIQNSFNMSRKDIAHLLYNFDRIKHLKSVANLLYNNYWNFEPVIDYYFYGHTSNEEMNNIFLETNMEQNEIQNIKKMFRLKPNHKGFELFKILSAKLNYSIIYGKKVDEEGLEYVMDMMYDYFYDKEENKIKTLYTNEKEKIDEIAKKMSRNYFTDENQENTHFDFLTENENMLLNGFKYDYTKQYVSLYDRYNENINCAYNTITRENILNTIC